MKNKKLDMGITVNYGKTSKIIIDAVSDVYLKDKEKYDAIFKVGNAALSNYESVRAFDNEKEDADKLGAVGINLQHTIHTYFMNCIFTDYPVVSCDKKATIVVSHFDYIFKKLIPRYLFESNAYLTSADEEIKNEFVKKVYKKVKRRLFRYILQPVQK